MNSTVDSSENKTDANIKMNLLMTVRVQNVKQFDPFKKVNLAVLL